MKRTLPLILVGVLLVLFSACRSHTAGAGRYARLDSLLEVQGDIVARYEMHLDSLKRCYRMESDDYKRYLLLHQLCVDYSSFQNDSARFYLKLAQSCAVALGDTMLVNECRLQNVHVLSGAGLLETAQREIESIDPDFLPPDQLGMYHRLLIEYYIYQAEYNHNTEYEQEYVDRLVELRKEALDNLSPSDRAYLLTRAESLSDQDKRNAAIDLLLGELKHWHCGERTYSILTSTIAFIYSQGGHREEQKHYLILSAESDLEGAIRENTSLRVLSSLLFDEGDFDRAYRYLNCCISDATFYGARLRNTQASSLMPKVLTAYYDSQRSSHRNVLILLVLMSCAALAFAAALFGLYIVFSRLRRTSSALAGTNEKLHERERVKEEYLGRFLALSSQFIEQTDTRRKSLLRMARDKKTQELVNELKSTEMSDMQAKLFYENFDAAFLNIFPDFCQYVNALLEPDGQITPPASNTLTTELRILALMRLGITSNQLIARILRSGLSTVYTYRSRLKSRAFDHDNFEEQVKQILNN